MACQAGERTGNLSEFSRSKAEIQGRFAGVALAPSRIDAAAWRLWRSITDDFADDLNDQAGVCSINRESTCPANCRLKLKRKGRGQGVLYAEISFGPQARSPPRVHLRPYATERIGARASQQLTARRRPSACADRIADFAGTGSTRACCSSGGSWHGRAYSERCRPTGSAGPPGCCSQVHSEPVRTHACHPSSVGFRSSGGSRSSHPRGFISSSVLPI